jgi:Fe-S-cluster containining protein
MTMGQDTATATIEFTVSGVPIHAEITVPTGPTRPSALLPMFNELAETIVRVGVDAAESRGERVSCQKGCGACCRQLVPISEIEATRLGEVIRELPEARRRQVLSRFQEGRRRLQDAGLLEKLNDPEQFTDGELRSLGLEYFRLGIACPFLEDESCSIYQDRPLACREYLVTSPAAHCAEPTAETVHCVPIPAKVSKAVALRGDSFAGCR